MRKLILIAAMSLLASQAYADGPRSLSLAATNASPQTAEQPATTAATPPQGPAAAPSNVQTATTAPTSTPPAATATTTAIAPAATQSSAAPVASTRETTKPKRRQPSTEARVIRELHRHGIYW
ncbi:hypothetical protein [Bradyrhizobium sp. WSM471]|uniref:hypothetical protein n=1 Tax=Bradyrhizobium sp. WSM471 TaxID=319017 RepID=UPI00024D3150|nr:MULTISPECIES: hypothetical protein [Bradyrhizobium]EHR06365.1 hypothetical protein Bra471DRAFT_07219 [Bradyrhizobium sp. WSM471]UFW41438.1 hypothetical protein BcanWSM471_35480 [Bradyrhizobium canariense]